MIAQITDSNSAQVITVLVGLIAIVASANLLVGFVNGLRTMMGKKPDAATQFENLGLRITNIENKTTSVEQRLLEKMATSSAEMAAIKESVSTLTLTMSNVETKLDRWIEGELAETRRQLGATRTPAARRSR